MNLCVGNVDTDSLAYAYIFAYVHARVDKRIGIQTATGEVVRDAEH